MPVGQLPLVACGARGDSTLVNGWPANNLPRDPQNNTTPTWRGVPETAPCPHMRSLKLSHNTARVLETAPHL